MNQKQTREPQIAGPDETATARKVEVGRLRRYVRDIFTAHGLSKQDASICAAALIMADLRGVWSHGVARTAMYCARLTNGVAKPQPHIQIEEIFPSVALVDGDDGLGLVVAKRAMSEAIARAHKLGIGLVGVRRSGHFGMAALYIQQAVDADCLGWSFTNASPALPPWGGRSAFFGTSPFGFGAPMPEGEPPFVVDMAMSVVARGKLKFAAQRGQRIPEGFALDSEGRPTTDGDAAFNGVVLPFGGVKGAALSWMMDVLGGVFTGANFGGDVANPFTGLDRPQNVGHVFIAARADLFMSIQEFKRRMENLSMRAKSLDTTDGFVEICTPGELEQRRLTANSKNGIPLSADVVSSLTSLGQAYNIDWPFAE